jgi:predicted GIY-YIG superfamily endonuclease
MNGHVYLLHLAEPLGNERHQAAHYIGWAADDPYQRLAEHIAGRGAKMLAAANERGIDYWIVRTWPGGRELERKLKNRKDAPKRLCPICRNARKMARWQQPLPGLENYAGCVQEMRF